LLPKKNIKIPKTVVPKAFRFASYNKQDSFTQMYTIKDRLSKEPLILLSHPMNRDLKIEAA